MPRHRVLFGLTACCVWFLTFPGSTRAAAHKSPKNRGGLIAGLGSVHHPVSTNKPQAQQFFDQGLALVYGFNHDEAQRSFQRAAEIDPKLAMAWWGVALALGPNINIPIDPEREKAAWEAGQRALALQDNASEAERGYINALAFRYSKDPKADLAQLDIAYRDAMSRLVRRYPDDLDAATLYAESLMDLHPWRLWFHDGRPNEGTEELVAVLESVLRRDPNHLGANHYYIHAIEASPHAERGLASAARLEKLAPSAGHLVHMPSHIYARVGDHIASVRCNERAVAADKKYLATHPPTLPAVMYHAHNVHFVAYAACMNGNFTKAKSAADQVAAVAEKHVKEMPEMEGFLSSFICTPEIVLVGFERWKDILKLPFPDPSLTIPTAAWLFARGMAFANVGDPNSARKEQAAWQSVTAKISPDELVNETNKAGEVLKIHGNLLSAAIARSEHNQKNALDFLNAAVAAEDALNYAEPPAFYPPVRSLLGRALLETNQASEAERVFRADLERNPRSLRSLAGLRDCLTAQKRLFEADQIDQQLNEAKGTTDSVSSLRARK